MRVLAITYCRAMFGANRALFSMMKDMRERYGVEFEVLMPAVNDGELAEVLDAEGFIHYEMSMKMWVYPVDATHKGLRGISTRIKTFFFANSIDKLLRHNRYDLVYTNNSTVQYGAILAKKWKVPHIWHVREFGKADYDIEFSYPVKIRTAFFKRASAVVAISDAVAEYARKELCPGANIQRVYDGIYFDKKLRVPGQREVINIVCVGTLQPGKGQSVLLEAVKMLVWGESADSERKSADGVDSIRVFIVGSGPTEEFLRKYVTDNGIESVVEFCGYRSDVRSLLDTMDIGVICSRLEGFGLVTCEYMEASLPVIGADSGATTELVEDGVNGYLYPPGNAIVLSDRLRLLIENRDLLCELGRNSYECVKREFTLERNTDNMYSVFRNAIKL